MTSLASLSTLPTPGPEELAHSRRVAQHIREFIAARGGVIGFDTFMRLALYAPGLGYYSAGATKIGDAGDFVTAPEVSSLFSRCVAHQVAEVLDRVGGGEVFELGAGTGRLAADLLTELAALGALPSRYRILEVSADLAERQRARLARLPPALAARIEWVDRWPSEATRGVWLANEVLDAMPVDRFVLRGEPGAQVVHSLGVAAVDEGFEWREQPASAELDSAVRGVLATSSEPLPDGYVSEICLALQPWMASLAGQVERGVALLMDYGLAREQLYHPDRGHGTLICHYRHRAHADPFLHVGLQDITAWVDFTGVADAADATGLEVLGYATQAAFLIGAGMDRLLTADMQAADGDPRRQAQLAGEARRLLLPGEMGETFKVIALGRGYDAPLSGFATHTLDL